MYPNTSNTMNIRLGAKQDLAERVINYLQAFDIDCFVGGSVRFGCQSTDSDVDIIVYVPDHMREFFMKVVYQTGVRPVQEDDTDIYNNSKIKVVHLGSDIDLLTVSDKEYFDQEKNNHHMIERMVSGFSRPYGKTLIDYILDLKGHGVKGATIYQMLVVAARER